MNQCFPSLHNKRLSYWRLTGFRRNDEGAGRRFYHLRRGISPQSLLGMKKEAVKKG
jgi:hypothetical protein